jgi:hypothetical protein
VCVSMDVGHNLPCSRDSNLRVDGVVQSSMRVRHSKQNLDSEFNFFRNKFNYSSFKGGCPLPPTNLGVGGGRLHLWMCRGISHAFSV